MSPFLLFIVLVPLITSLVLILGVVIVLVHRGPEPELLMSLVIFGSLAGGLIIMLRRFASPKGALLELASSTPVDDSVKRKVGNTALVLTCMIVGSSIVFLFQIEETRNWIGVVCFIMGLAFVISGLAPLRRNVIEESARNIPVTADNRDRLRRMLIAHSRRTYAILALYPVLGGYAIWIYFSTAAQKYFSLFDLAGSIFLLGSSGAWFVLYGKFLRKQLALKRNKNFRVSTDSHE